MGNKLDWEDAPKWAKYLAMDRSGRWHWYEEKPFIADSTQWGCNGRYEICASWELTLETRPS